MLEISSKITKLDIISILQTFASDPINVIQKKYSMFHNSTHCMSSDSITYIKISINEKQNNNAFLFALLETLPVYLRSNAATYSHLRV